VEQKIERKAEVAEIEEKLDELISEKDRYWDKFKISCEVEMVPKKRIHREDELPQL